MSWLLQGLYVSTLRGRRPPFHEGSFPVNSGLVGLRHSPTRFAQLQYVRYYRHHVTACHVHRYFEYPFSHHFHRADARFGRTPSNRLYVRASIQHYIVR